MSIHPTAIVEDGASVHASTIIGPYSLIERGAIIGADCVIGSCVRISGLVQLGRGNRIDHGAALGGNPQDLGFSPDQVQPLTIGDHNQFREGVTVSAGLKSAHGTRIGHHNFLMANAHVGHDCLVGDHNVLANGATLAGHVELEHHIFLSGQVAVHQFCRIGAYSLVAGVSGVPQDVPPFVLADGHRARIVGINVIGLRRNGFSSDRRQNIKAVYRTIFRSGLRLAEALVAVETDFPSPDTRQIVGFVQSSRRGILSFVDRRYGISDTEAATGQDA